MIGSASDELNPIFETVTAILPDLEIIDPTGRILKPKVTTDEHGNKKFVYATKVGETPWFVLREANINLSNGKILKIPETKFILVDGFALNLMISIAP